MAPKIDHDGFVAMLVERFPAIAGDIDNSSRGLLHCEMATFARATQLAIDNHDMDTIRRHFEFIDEVFRMATPEVENAVNVSYLENLRFKSGKTGLTTAGNC